MPTKARLAKNDLTLSLNKILDQETFPALIGILAQDRIRRERAIQYLLDQKPEAQRKINRLKAEDLSLSKLKSFFEETASLSLFEKETIYIIDGAQAFNAELSKVIKESIPNSPRSNVIILSGTKFLAAVLQAIIQNGALVELPELKGVELRNWTAKEYKRAGLTLSDNRVIESTLELADDSPDKVASIVEHVSLYCESPVVTI